MRSPKSWDPRYRGLLCPVTRSQVPWKSYVITLMKSRYLQSINIDSNKRHWDIMWCFGGLRTLRSVRFRNLRRLFPFLRTLRRSTWVETCRWFSLQLHRLQQVPFNADEHFSWYILAHRDSKTKTKKSRLTLQSKVNLFLSSGGLPRDPGYSQSKSNPSNPWVLRNLIEDWMNFWRLAGVDTMMENLEGWKPFSLSLSFSISPWRW